MTENIDSLIFFNLFTKSNWLVLGYKLNVNEIKLFIIYEYIYVSCKWQICFKCVNSESHICLTGVGYFWYFVFQVLYKGKRYVKFKKLTDFILSIYKS